MDQDAINIILNPGLSFGTGEHATTQMCLKFLREQHLQDKIVLDYGSGSGILAIAASKLGAKLVIGVDNDPLAIKAAKENSALNKISNIKFLQVQTYKSDCDVQLISKTVVDFLGDGHRWGLIPSFTKPSEKPDFFRMFNARSETLAERPSFRRLLTTNRCVVILQGFYEWHKPQNQPKQPYYIHLKDSELMYMAGLWDVWKNEEGELMYSCTICTTSPSKRFEWLHNRMPVIFQDQKTALQWLDADNSLKACEAYLKPLDSPSLQWYKVTPKMGSPQYDCEDCVKNIQTDSNPLKNMFGKSKQLQQNGVNNDQSIRKPDAKQNNQQNSKQDGTQTLQVKQEKEFLENNMLKFEQVKNSQENNDIDTEDKGSIKESNNHNQIKKEEKLNSQENQSFKKEQHFLQDNVEVFEDKSQQIDENMQKAQANAIKSEEQSQLNIQSQSSNDTLKKNQNGKQKSQQSKQNQKNLSQESGQKRPITSFFSPKKQKV